MTQLAVAVSGCSPSSLSANATTATQVTVTTEDASGNEAHEGTYVTLALTGPETLNSVGGPTTETLFVSGATVPISVWSIMGEPGTIALRATSTASGITSGTLTIPTYINTAPASLKVTSSTGTDSDGRPYTLYTVQVRDTDGNSITNTSGSTDAISVSKNASTQGALSNPAP